MLKGISPLLSPELLKTLAEMGHGDELVIGDRNFPAVSMGQRCLHAEGHSGADILDAILALFPLDAFVEAPVFLMEPTPGTYDGEPPIWETYKAVVEKHAPGTKVGYVERFAFYDRTRQAYATVSTGETGAYGCIILKKGCL